MEGKCPFCGAEVDEESSTGLLWFKCLTTEEIDEMDQAIYDRHAECYGRQIATLTTELQEAKERLEGWRELKETLDCYHHLGVKSPKRLTAYFDIEPLDRLRELGEIE